MLKRNMKHKSQIKRLGDTFKWCDLYPETPGFTVEGKKKFQSIFGSAVSLVIFGTMLIYGASGYEGVITRSETKHESSPEKNSYASNKDNLGELKFDETHTAIALSFHHASGSYVPREEWSEYIEITTWYWTYSVEEAKNW